MGCCESTMNQESVSQITDRLKNSVKTGNAVQLVYLVNQLAILKSKSSLSKSEPKKPEISSQEAISETLNYFTFEASSKIKVNVPGYCILCGQINLFKFIHQKFTISILELEKVFEKSGCSVLSFICTRGYHEILEYYMPLSMCLSFSTNRTSLMISELSLNLSSNIEDTLVKDTFTPIQLATYFGHINCLRVIQKHFENKDPPYYFSFNFQDVSTGENCGLLACRSKNYSMIKYLHQTTSTDFNLLNYQNENALQIFLCACKYAFVSDALKIVKYLVEVIKINYLNQIEEVLLTCDSLEIIDYLEEKCREAGLTCSKRQVEQENSLKFGKKITAEKEPPKVSVLSHPSSISDYENSPISNLASIVNQIIN